MDTMNRSLAALAVMAACGCAWFFAVAPTSAADSIPLPRPRPNIEAALKYGPPPIFEAADLHNEMSPCQLELQKIADIEPVFLLNPSELCGSDDIVRLKAVLRPGLKPITLNPPPELRCKMAASVALWLRDDVSPRFTTVSLSGIANYNSYECRPRNRLFGSRLSEHGKANAIDVRSFLLADGSIVDPTDPLVARPLREQFRHDACARFSTVLGPGSDGFHEKHIHLDLAERRNGYKSCSWVVRNPFPSVVAGAAIPMPRPRPVSGELPGAGND